MDGLIPWRGGGGGGQESRIDRFDARAMLDMYVPPRVQSRPKTDEELELEEVRCVFLASRAVLERIDLRKPSARKEMAMRFASDGSPNAEPRNIPP